MSIEVEVEKDPEIWNEIVRKSQFGTIFHTWEWLKIAEKYSSSRLYPLVGYKGSTPIGVYPIFLQRKKFLRFAFSPPPRLLLLYLGPAFIDYQKLKQSRKESIFLEFQRSVDEFIKNLKCGYVRIRTPPGLIDSRPLKWSGYRVDPLYTYVIKLYDTEEVWRNLNRKLRTGIERTKKEGVKVELGDKEDLEYIRVSLYERFKKQGAKPKKSYYKEYLQELYNQFYPDNMKIFIARYKGESVGGLVVLCFKDWSALWIGIPKTEIRGIYPNDLAQWEAIKWACKSGFKYYEEMDAGNPRFRHFKAKYNPEIVPWYSAEKYSHFYSFLKILRNLIGGVR